MVSVNIYISIWFVACPANRYLWRAFHCCLFAQIVNVTLLEIELLPIWFKWKQSAFARPHHTKKATCLQPSKKKGIKSTRNSFCQIERTQKNSTNRKESLVISPCCLVRCMQWVCRHTFFASSANESLWALTLECPRDINTCAAILAWIAFTARTFVDVWEKNTSGCLVS